MMMMPLKIKQFINPVTGFFTHMDYDFGAMTAEQLDILFFANHGERNPAPIVTNILSEVPTTDELVLLSAIVKAMYASKWDKLKALYEIEYNPIANYKDQLTEEISNTDVNNVTEDLSTLSTRTDTTSKDSTRTDNLSSTGNKTSTTALTSDTDDGIYGFNSSEATNSDTSKIVESGNDVTNATGSNTGTQQNVVTGTDTTSDSRTSDNIKVSSNNGTRTRVSTHEGNIGNLTTQQLMTQEIELWKWNFIQTVLADLNDFLTIPIYLS